MLREKKGLPYVDEKRRHAQEAHVKQETGVLGAAVPPNPLPPPPHSSRSDTKDDTAVHPQSMPHFVNVLAHKLSHSTAGWPAI